MPPRVAILSIATDNWGPLRAVTFPNLSKYCEKRGYTFIGSTEADPSRPASWSKVQLLLRHMADFDWLVWVDADAVAADFEQGVERYLDPSVELVISADDISGINCGIMVWRCCPESSDCLTRLWNSPESKWFHGWWEQQALREMIDGGTAKIKVKKVGKAPSACDPLNCFVAAAPHMAAPLFVHAPCASGSGAMEWKIKELLPYAGGDCGGVTIPKCMKSISPERVIAALETLLQLSE